MKQLIRLFFILLLPLSSFSQIEWTGIMHGNQFEFLPDAGGISSCEFTNPNQDYAYYDFEEDYCVSVQSMGLPDERMESIYITPEGEVMIGTHSGFVILRPDQTLETYNFRTSRLPRAASIEAIFKDAEGVIWVSGEAGGVFALFPDGWRVYPMMIGSPFPGTAYGFAEDYLGDIWACGSFGVGRYDRDEDTWQIFHHTNSTIPIGGYTDLAFDDDFNLWVAHQWDGLIHFNTGTFQTTKYNTANSGIASNFISSLHFESDGLITDHKIWYGAADNGFGYYHIADNTWTHWSADDYPDWLNGEVYDIARAKEEGVFWLATFGGIVKFDNGTFKSYSPGLGNYHAFQNRDIAVDTTTGQVWGLSVENGPGIIYPWGASGQLNRFNNGALNTNAFRKVAISPSGEPWVVGRDNPGVIAFYRGHQMRNASFGKQGLSYISNDIAFKDDLAYVATDNGFWSFDYRILSNWTHHTNNDQLDEVNAVEVDPAGNIWLCTKDGLYRFDGNDYTEYNTNDGLPDEWVTHVAFEPNGAFWVGTKAGGLARFDSNGNLTKLLNTADGLPSNEIWELFYDGTTERIYAATEAGLSHWNELEIIINNYPPMSTSPLGSRFRSVVVDPSGQIYAGSLAGFGVYELGLGWQMYDETNSPMGDKSVNDIAIDQTGNKWLVGLSSVAGGLYRFDDGGPGVVPNQNQIIRGLVFNDLNLNGIYEPAQGESPKTNLLVRLNRQSNSSVTFSTVDAAGYYEFFLTANDQYEVRIIPNPSQFITQNNGGDYLLDFSMSPISPDTLPATGLGTLVQGRPAFEVDVTLAKIRCNESIAVDLQVTNIGDETAIDPSYQISFDDDLLDLVGYTVLDHRPFTAVEGQVAWSAPVLRPLQQENIRVYFTGPPESEAGNALSFTGLGKTFFNNVEYAYEAASMGTIYCGVDPNDKLVDPAGIGANHETHPDSLLTYTVRFQNTGNDYAYNVAILDTLDANLDIETFRLINTSHPVLFDLLPGNVLNFSFPGIMLPDSARNYLGSQGFVKYEIKAREDIAENTPIYNTAYITFDQNYPIQTNTVFNTMTSMLTGLSEVERNRQGKIILYPNPAENEVTLEFENEQERIHQIDLYNLLGERLRVYTNINSNRFQLERDQLPSGVYTIVVSGNQARYSAKVIFQ